MSMIEIKSEKLTVGIDSKGSELMYIKGKDGTDFLWNGDPEVWSFRAPILFPICGGLKDDTYTYNGKSYTLPKHGFARRSEFSGRQIDDTKAEFVLESNSETLKNFPFKHRLKITFELMGNELKITNSVENLSSDEMYFSIGSHEALYCPEGIEEYEVRFPGKQTLDSYLIDGNLLLDETVRILDNEDCLPLQYDYFSVDALVFKDIIFNKAMLVHKNSTKRVSVEFDGAGYFLLWTKPGAKYICLEPWHGIQDSIHSDGEIAHKEGIIKLPKGETFTAVHTISCFE